MFKKFLERADRGLSTTPHQRRFDYIALLTTGFDVCTAVCFHPKKKKFIGSNNAGSGQLFDEYMELFKTFLSTSKRDEEKITDLIKKTFDGARKLFKSNQIPKLPDDKKQIIQISDKIGDLEELQQEYQIKLGEAKKRLDEAKEPWKVKLVENEKKLASVTSKLSDLEKYQSDPNSIYYGSNEFVNQVKAKKKLDGERNKIELNFSEPMALVSKYENAIQAKIKEIADLNTTDYQERKSILEKDLKFALEKEKGKIFEDTLYGCLEKVLDWIQESGVQIQSDGTIHEFVENPLEPEWSSARTHAEMNLLEYLHAEEEIGKDWCHLTELLYIGLNKLCCAQCSYTIYQINQKYQKIKKIPKVDYPFITRGKHQKYSKNWKKPSFFLDLGLETVESACENKENNIKFEDLVQNNEWSKEESKPFISPRV